MERRFDPAEIGERQPLKGRLAVVTGTSRGIGAEIARALAGAGCDIVGCHADPAKTKRQESIDEELRSYGVDVDSVVCDITTVEGREELLSLATQDMEATSRSSSHLMCNTVDYLILNAAGGLEDNKPVDWAGKINTEAQLALVRDFSDFMCMTDQGGVIIYVTSLWAHRFGEVRQLPFYYNVAKTKHRTEELLRLVIPQLAQEGIKVAFLCGHLVEGTSAFTLFERMGRQNPQFGQRLEKIKGMAEGGWPVTAQEMGQAALSIVLNRGFESGTTFYVGGTRAEELTDADRLPKLLSRREIQEFLPMYDEKTLLVEEFCGNSLSQSGVGKRQVRVEDTDGHFAGEYNDIRVYPGHWQMEFAFQALGLVYLIGEATGDKVPLVTGVAGPISFDRMVKPGDEVIAQAEVLYQSPSRVVGDCRIMVGDRVCAKIGGIELKLVSPQVARRMYRSN